MFETEKGCSLLELKKAEIDTSKKVQRVAYLVTATKARNMIWGIKLYGEDEDEILLHLNWLEFNPIIAEWKY